MRRYLMALGAASLICIAPAAASAQSRIAVGDTVDGALDARDARLGDDSYYDCYLLRIDRPQSVAITLKSSAFDAYLGAGHGVTCGGEAAETNDDGPSMGTDSYLALELGQGEYFIRANSLSADKTGGYTLSIAPIQGGSDDNVTTLEGRLGQDDRKLADGSYYDCVDVRGREGQQLTAGMESEDFDTYLAILEGGGCQGSSLGTNDDGDDLGTDSLLAVTLPSDGVYSIRANSLSANQTGAYLLHYALD
ncbi:MAG: peptidase [Brevundimonas sp.]|uniref:peptidase n=1 Tax=Brevundimonas sp. TaxID=1871086 RepID=UPI001210C51A|nr:peptidase [Brevundimonas sp.]RZJ16617.1 MAG: peptidase [Brevundimonas sp.]